MTTEYDYHIYNDLYLSSKSSRQYNTASIWSLIRKTTVFFKSYQNQPISGVLTEGGKLKSIGVTGFSTEGKEGRLPTDKGPETANIKQYYRTSQDNGWGQVSLRQNSKQKVLAKGLSWTQKFCSKQEIQSRSPGTCKLSLVRIAKQFDSLYCSAEINPETDLTSLENIAYILDRES